MKVYLRTEGKLREQLAPDVDAYTKAAEAEEGATVGDILDALEFPRSLVAFCLAGGQLRRLDHKPSDGETIMLQPPVSGG